MWRWRRRQQGARHSAFTFLHIFLFSFFASFSFNPSTAKLLALMKPKRTQKYYSLLPIREDGKGDELFARNNAAQEKFSSFFLVILKD